VPNSWLDLLTESTRELEPPERFWWWSGLSTIASIVKKGVYLDRFSYVLYPNVYVVLVSAQSGLRKGVPISWAKSVLEILDCTRTISGQYSFPEVIHELSQQVTTSTGKVYNEAQALLCAPELDSFLLGDDKSLPTLTDLYDTHAHKIEWKKGLKSGKEILKKPCINILGASNEELFEDVVKTRDIKGGFLARTFIIHERKRRVNNSLMERPKDLLTLQDLADPLKRLIGLTGEFKIPTPVRRHYDKWYNDISDAQIEDNTGTMDRLGDSVLKVAMLVSLAKSNDLIIDIDSLREAIAKCEATMPGIRRVSMNGKSEISPIIAEVTKLLVDSPDRIVERSFLLRRIRCEPLQLDRAIDTLVQSDILEEPGTMRHPITDKLVCRMTKEAYEKFLNELRNQP